MYYDGVMEKQLQDAIKQAVKTAYDVDLQEVHLEHPENPLFGDFSTNVALLLIKYVDQPALLIAKKLAYELNQMELSIKIGEKMVPLFKSIDFAPPGFLNFTLSVDWLKNVLWEISEEGKTYGARDFLDGHKVMIEYTDPNPFKVFHIGHLMTNAIGESLAGIHEFLGAEVYRVNYQGDVGMHVAKSLWGLLNKMEEDDISLADLEQKPLVERVAYLGAAYAKGATAFKDNEKAVSEMKGINFQAYLAAQEMLIETENWEPVIDFKAFVDKEKQVFDYEQVKEAYIKGREWSLDYFETIYSRLGSEFEHYYFESKVGELGLDIVNNNIDNGVFEKDDGAVIFKGETFGLHTRVFANSLGLPVYEAKDLGLAFLKSQDVEYDSSIIVTANEINTYFEVVLKAMSLINPDLAAKTKHLGHGMMKFKEGKMSSRTGKIIGGEDLVNEVRDVVLEKMKTSETNTVPSDQLEETADKISVAAVKYTILKNGIGNDISYDPDAITSLQGNTGPYLLYTHARTNSVLEKAYGDNKKEGFEKYEYAEDLAAQESEVLRHIYKFPEVVGLSGERLAPNLIATYLHDLAQKYNTLYAELPINTASPGERELRLHITYCVRQVLRNGLRLLGIPVVDKM